MVEGPEDGSQSVVEAYANAMGEYYQPDAPPTTPETPATETGAPAAVAVVAATEPATPAAPAPEPGATEPAAETTSSTTAETPDEFAAILAAGTPATYQVDGTDRTDDTIRIVAGDVGIIDTANLPGVLKRLGERDHLFESDRQKYQAIQQYERLSAWTRTGEDGKEQNFTGQAGLAEMRLDYARVLTERNVYESLFTDPATLFNLLMQDEQGKIVLNPERVEALALRAALQTQQAQDAVRKDFMVRAQPPAPTFDLATATQHAPALIAQAAGADASLLSAEQKALLAQHMGRYVRDVLPGERGLHGKIVDASFADLVRSFVTQAKAATTAATTASTTAAANAAKLAAATRGLPTRGTPRAAATPPKPPAPPSDSDDAWDLHERAAARALKAGRS